MIADQTLDAAANAFREGAELLADAAPNGRFETAPHGTSLLFTGTPIPLLNAVLGLGREPDAAEIAALADRTASYTAQQLPWTIRLRGSATAEVTAVAAGHGLTGRTESRMMVLPLTTDPGPGTARVLSGAEYETFANVLGAAFGAPPQIVSGLYNAATLDRPELDAYVLESNGTPRTVGLAVRTGDFLYLANIATDPEHRRRGHALALTNAMLRDGRAAGAHTAFLHSADDTVPLFSRAGFRAVETWTTFAAA